MVEKKTFFSLKIRKTIFLSSNCFIFNSKEPIENIKIQLNQVILYNVDVYTSYK